MKFGFLDLIQSQFTLGLTVPNLNGTMLQQVPNIPNGILANMPQQVHDFLAFVSVEELHTAYDNTAVVYTGNCRFDGGGQASATPSFQSSTGSLLQLQDLGFQFRVTIPRKDSPSMRAAFTAAGAGLTGGSQTDYNSLTAVLAKFGGNMNNAAPSDFPNIDFRIELLFNTVTLHLPNDTFIPARLNSDGWLERDPGFDEVKISLPKIALQVSQNNDNYNNTQVQFVGWGINSLDEGGDTAAREMISMTPGLCLHSSGTVGFGLEKIILDLSTNFTPAEILENNFGVGDDFTGLWIPEVRLFIAPSGMRGYAFDTWAKDMLIDFDQGLSGEFGIELVNGAANAKLEVQTICFQGSEARNVTAQGADQTATNAGVTSVTRNTRVSVAANGKIHVRIRGGRPVYNITVKKKTGFTTLADARDNGTVIPATAVSGHPNANEWALGESAAGQLTIYIKVEDGRHNTHEERLQATLLAPGASSTSFSVVQDPVIENITASGHGNTIALASAQPDNDAVFITTQPAGAIIKVGSTEISRNSDGTYRIPCQRNNTPVHITAEWQPDQVPVESNNFVAEASIKSIINSHGENFEYVYYGYDNPGGSTSNVPNPNHRDVNSDEYINEVATFYLQDTALSNRLQTFLNNRRGRMIEIYGYASYESHNDSAHLTYNDTLSHRRARVLKAMFLQLEPGANASLNYLHTATVGDYTNTGEHAKGDQVAKHDSASRPQDPDYHVAVAYYAPVAGASENASADVRRPLDIVQQVTTRDVTPAADAPQRPEFFRRMAIKVRFQRNKLVLAELSGQLDFGKEAEVRTEHVRNTAGNNGSTPSAISQSITSTNGATDPNAPDSSPAEHHGLVDFKFSMLYNEATRKLTQTLELGFDKDNLREGLLSVTRFQPYPLADTTASLLLFAPLLQSGIEAIQSAQTDNARTAAIVLAGTELALATTLGLVAIKMDRITLFGGTLSFTETSPDIWLWNAQSLDEVGIIFDYGVQFKINLDLGILQIKTRENDANGNALQAPFVRYKAIGFKFNFEGGQVKYIPIFDTSKGYELSLGDPGALQVLVLGQDIGNLLKILTARLARENPFILEMDLALGINLGIITVDKIRVTVKVNDGGGAPDIFIIPTKVSVDIPGALIGQGYLDVGRPNNVQGSAAEVHGGFKGFVDITLVPIKLRIAASLGIGPVSKDGRSATAFFLGLEVELPAAIPLGSTGIGIYGFLGLFGMHYKRSEPAEADGQLPPALRWFDEVVHGNVIDISGWEPELDRWSFGLGIILGTMEGGFVLNLKGMFMLELPGPRILIFVKANLLFPKPKDVKNGNQQTVGILAVIDLDFNIGRLTIGLIIQYEIESILSLRVPVEAQFNFDDVANWHVYIGSNKLPAEARILGIVRGYAYLMFSGKGIDDFPNPGEHILNGFSIAMGLGASIVFGDKDSGLYLEVAGDFKAGIGFSPLAVYGMISLRGELHLWIISISAWASLEVRALTEQNETTHKSEFITKIHGEACGKVSFLFFDIEGCVTIDIGPEPPEKAPARLVKALTLVSRSSALILGQGVDRPIDGALGKAFVMAKDNDNIDNTQVPVVSIDAIPALDLVAAPDISGATTFTDALPAPINAPSGYWVDGSDGKSKVRYKIISIELDNGLMDDTLPKPANWWPRENDQNHPESGTTLALLCWTPDPTPHAIQQSEVLTKNIEHKWGTTCNPAAPATSILWTFNKKPLGYNSAGWNLYGTMWPDPPGTIRSSVPSKKLFVHEQKGLSIPFEDQYRLMVKNTILEHAKVIGGNTISIPTTGERIPAGKVLQFPVEHLYPQREPGRNNNDAVQLTAELKAYYEKEETEQILVDCEALAGGNILLAVDAKMTAIQNILFRSLDDKGKVTEEYKATDFTVTVINSINDLPLHWRDPSGPWYQDVQLVLIFLSSLLKMQKYMLYMVQYTPKKEPRRFSIVTRPQKKDPSRAATLLCAAELTEAAEIERESFDQMTQNSKQEILMNAFEGDKKRPLLKKNTQYTLTVNYSYDIMRDGQVTASDTDKERMVFKTDAKAPIRIDPWVLATTPQNDMNIHFVQDAVQVIFNDDSVFQLYKAYGHELKVTIRKANGNHPEQDEDQMTLDDVNPNLTTIKGVVKSAFHHALDESIKNVAPCITTYGEYKEHSVFTLPIPLMRNTTYMMEIESKTPDAPPPGEPKSPLYKLSFTTSRYLSMDELASIISGSYINTRVLKNPLALLPATCSDNDIQSKFIDAGLDALAPVEDPAVTLFWTPDGSSFVLSAILVDAPESLWRQRPFPYIETVVDDEGKPMKHWIMKDLPEMEIVENGSGLAQAIVHNLTGTRSIIYLKNTAAGNTIKLQLKRYVFDVDPANYNKPAYIKNADLLSIDLPALPPWVEEE